jgi:uncharacterized membrane protein
MRYEQVIDIDAAPGIVWDVMTDIERWPQWTRSIRSAQMLDGGALGPNSRAKLAVAGSGIVSTWEVTSLEPGRSFVWESQQPGVRNVAGHYVEPRDRGGSRVRLTIDMSGAVAALMRPWMAYVTRRNVGWEIEGLKRRSEERAAQGPR